MLLLDNNKRTKLKKHFNFRTKSISRFIYFLQIKLSEQSDLKDQLCYMQFGKDNVVTRQISAAFSLSWYSGQPVFFLISQKKSVIHLKEY